MAQRNEKVFERVRQELSKNPSLGSRELYELAQGVDKSIAQDTLQQFHARYVLPVKRERAKAGGGRGGRRTRAGAAVAGGRRGRRAAAAAPEAGAEQPAQTTAGRRRGRRPASAGAAGAGQGGGASREQVRSVLLQFAQELTDAESRSSLVKVLSRVDNYVDRIVPRG